jgi:uncharacterized protein (TIGR02453 family)
MNATHITRELFEFFRELKRNNRKEWFRGNKERYELQVRLPLQGFIVDFEQSLRRISPHFRADPRPVGGSLFRIYRDVRFSPDKSPYKTHGGIQFRHEQGRDVHAPGFYLHLEPDNVFAAVGIWHPDSAALGRIREAIAADPAAWLRAKSDPGFGRVYELSGESLKRAPQGYDPSHPQIEDLKRKDFIAHVSLSEDDACAPDFLDRYARLCAGAAPFMRFLTETLDLPW